MCMNSRMCYNPRLAPYLETGSSLKIYEILGVGSQWTKLIEDKVKQELSSRAKINFIKLFGILYGWKAFNLVFLDLYLDFSLKKIRVIEVLFKFVLVISNHTKTLSPYLTHSNTAGHLIWFKGYLGLNKKYVCFLLHASAENGHAPTRPMLVSFLLGGYTS